MSNSDTSGDTDLPGSPRFAVTTFKDPNYKSGAFIPPRSPKDEGEELKQELEALNKTLAVHHVEQQEKTQQLAALEAELAASKSEQAFWEQMAAEVEAEKIALQQKFAAQQEAAATQPAKTTAAFVKAAATAADKVQLDEAATRRLIDAQLIQAGWTADSVHLRYSKVPVRKRVSSSPLRNGPLPMARLTTSSRRTRAAGRCRGEAEEPQCLLHPPAGEALQPRLRAFRAPRSRCCRSSLSQKVPGLPRLCRALM